MALPLVSTRVVLLIFPVEGAPTFIFEDQECDQFELSFHPRQALELENDHGFQTGTSEAFLALRGRTVTEAYAYRMGDLWLAFDNHWTLRVEPLSLPWVENWKLIYPRPGRPLRGDVSDSWSMEGYAGDVLEWGE